MEQRCALNLLVLTAKSWQSDIIQNHTSDILSAEISMKKKLHLKLISTQWAKTTGGWNKARWCWK